MPQLTSREIALTQQNARKKQIQIRHRLITQINLLSTPIKILTEISEWQHSNIELPEAKAERAYLKTNQNPRSDKYRICGLYQSSQKNFRRV